MGIFVIIGIVLGVVLSNNDESTESSALTDNREPIVLADYLTGQLSSKRFNGTWYTDDSCYYFDIISSFISYNVTTKEEKVIFSPVDTNLGDGFQFEFSADQKYLLVARQRLKIFRHSFLAFYVVLDLETKAVTPITMNGKLVSPKEFLKSI